MRIKHSLSWLAHSLYDFSQLKTCEKGQHLPSLYEIALSSGFNLCRKRGPFSR
jgi:hypothetical protein